MSWIKVRVRSAIVLLVMAGLAGCATKPESKDDAVAAREQAEQAAQQALQEDFSEAVMAMEAGDEESARQQLQAIHQQAPERTGPLANLGILAQQAGDQATAKARFEAVLALDSGHPVALNHLGVMARENGEFEKAETLYRDALSADPDYLPAMMNLAILLDIYLGRPADALPLYEQYQSMAEDPNPRLKDWIFDAKNRI